MNINFLMARWDLLSSTNCLFIFQSFYFSQLLQICYNTQLQFIIYLRIQHYFQDLAKKSKS